MGYVKVKVFVVRLWEKKRYWCVFWPLLVEQRSQRIPLIACLLYVGSHHFSFIFSFQIICSFFSLLLFLIFIFCFILLFLFSTFILDVLNMEKRLIIWYPCIMHFYFHIVTWLDWPEWGHFLAGTLSRMRLTFVAFCWFNQRSMFVVHGDPTQILTRFIGPAVYFVC